MRIDILTVLPEMFTSPLNCSILKRAQDKGLVEIHVHNIRDYTTNKHRKVDDYPFGGEAGMVMQIEPIDRAIEDLTSQRHYDEIIFTSPDGETFNQPMANSLSLLNNIIILCGHYKGIDFRIREHLITREISVGDYVLTGGELPALAITDAIVRGLSATNRALSATLSRTTCLRHRSTAARPNTKDGASPTFCCPDIRPRSTSGATTRLSNALADYAPTSSTTDPGSNFTADSGVIIATLIIDAAWNTTATFPIFCLPDRRPQILFRLYQPTTL